MARAATGLHRHRRRQREHAAGRVERIDHDPVQPEIGDENETVVRAGQRDMRVRAFLAGRIGADRIQVTQP